MHNWLIRPYKMPDYSAKVGIFVRMDKSKQYLPQTIVVRPSDYRLSLCFFWIDIKSSDM